MIRGRLTATAALWLALASLLALPGRTDAEAVPGLPDALLGPYALLVAALFAVIYLMRLVGTFITDLRAQRDLALAGWREQTAATNAVATAVEARNRSEEERLRIERAAAQARAEAEGSPGRRPRRRARTDGGVSL